MALEIIKRHTITAPVDVFAVARDLGIKVRKVSMPSNYSARIIREASGSFTIDLNINDPRTRQRFSLAHEIGHFLFHKHLIGDGVADSPLFRSPDHRVYENTPLEQHHETEANRFAANLLMPERLVRQLGRRYNHDIKQMARIFGVSVPAMRIRLGLEAYPGGQGHLFRQRNAV